MGKITNKETITMPLEDWQGTKRIFRRFAELLKPFNNIVHNTILKTNFIINCVDEENKNKLGNDNSNVIIGKRDAKDLSNNFIRLINEVEFKFEENLNIHGAYLTAERELFNKYLGEKFK